MNPYKIDRIINGLTTTIVILGVVLALSPVAKAESTKGPSLIWSTKASAVSNSTAALSTGHTQRAIKLATEALDKVKGADRVIALHNLCLAHLDRQDAAAANPFCAAALSEAPEALGPRTETLVVGNIERARQVQAASSGN